MKALRVTKGEVTRVIALEHYGVLNAMVNCTDIPDQEEDHVQLHLGGLDSHTNTHLRWSSIDLHVGDQVILEVIDHCDGDPADETETRDAALEEERLKQYIRNEAAKLGWTISENEN